MPEALDDTDVTTRFVLGGAGETGKTGKTAPTADLAFAFITTGDRAGLAEHLHASPFVIVVDWKEQDDAIVEYFGHAMPDEAISVAAVYDDRAGLAVGYNGAQYRIELTESPDDRQLTVEGMQVIIAPEYVVKLIRDSVGSDTWCYYVRPTVWWTRAEQENLDLLSSVFKDVPGEGAASNTDDLAEDEYPFEEELPPAYTPAAVEAVRLAARQAQLRIGS